MVAPAPNDSPYAPWWPNERRERERPSDPNLAEHSRLQTLKKNVVSELINRFESFVEDKKTPLPAQKYDTFKQFLEYLGKWWDSKNTLQAYTEILWRELVFDDIKLFELEYESMAMLLSDRDIWNRLDKKTQKILVDAIQREWVKIISTTQLPRSLQDQFRKIFEHAWENGMNFDEMDSLLNAFCVQNSISTDIIKQLKGVKIPFYMILQKWILADKMSVEDVRKLEKESLGSLSDGSKQIIGDLLQLYTIQDIVDITKTAEAEWKSLDALFAMPTLWSLYTWYPRDDQALWRIDPRLGPILANTASTPQEKERARCEAFVLSIQGNNPQLAELTEQIVAVAWDLNSLSPESQTLIYTLLKEQYLAKNKDALQKLQDTFSLPVEDARAFLDQLFDPAATEIHMKDAHGNILKFGISRTFMQWHSVTSLAELGEMNLPFAVELTALDNFDVLKDMRITTKLGKREDFFRLPWMTDMLHPDFTVRITDTSSGTVYNDCHISKDLHIPSDRNASTKADDLPFSLRVSDASRAANGVTHPSLPEIKSEDISGYKIEVVKKGLSLPWEHMLKLLWSYALMRRGTEMSPQERTAVIASTEKSNLADAANALSTEESPETSSNAEKTKEKNLFLQRFKEIAGDVTAEFWPDTELFLDVGDSYLPWWWRRYRRISFEHIDEEDSTFEAVLHGCEVSGEWDGESLWTFGQTPSDLDRLIKNKFVTNVFKFKRQKNVKERGMYLKNNFKPEQFSHDGMKSLITYVNSNVYINSLKSADTKQPLVYFSKEIDSVVDVPGKTPKDEPTKKIVTGKLTYKVEYNNDGVTVSLPEASRKKQMTMNEFMLFLAEKWLVWYTEADYKAFQKSAEKLAQEKTWGGRQWFSLGNILWGFSAALDGVKAHLKEQDEERWKKFKQKLFTSGVFASLKNLPIVGKAFDDMSSGIPIEMDAEKWKQIETYRDDCATKWGLWSSLPGKYIEATIFAKQDSIFGSDPLQVAGSLLYAMWEKGGSLYFRNLKQYKWTWAWVKMLLGKKYHAEWRKYHEDLERQLKRMQPGTADYNAKADDLAKSELKFIFARFNDWNNPRNANWLTYREQIYGTKFTWFIQGQVWGSLFSKWKIDAAAEEVSAKKFNDVYNEEFVSAHSALRMERVIGTQLALAQKVSDDSQYYRRCFAMLWPLMSGVHLDMLDDGYKSKYQDIAKMFGFPFAGYVRNMNAQRELTHLFDAISSSPSFHGDGSSGGIPKKFSDYVRFEWQSHDQIFSKMETRRWVYGKQLVDHLQDYNFIFWLIEEKKWKENQQFELAALNNYISIGVMTDDSERIGNNIDAGSPIYKKHMFSLSPGLVRQAMDQITPNGRFAPSAEKTAQPLRKAYDEKLSSISSSPATSAQAFMFYAKKYFDRFAWHYREESKRLFVSAAKHANSKNGGFLMKAAIRGVFDTMWWGDNLPSEVSSALSKMESFFRINAPLYIVPNGQLSQEFAKTVLNYEMSSQKFDELTEEKSLEYIQNNRRQWRNGLPIINDEYDYST